MHFVTCIAVIVHEKVFSNLENYCAVSISEDSDQRQAVL